MPVASVVPSGRRPVSPRLFNMLGFLACLLSLLFAVYLQMFEHIEPCPLCILQRIAIFALGIVFVVAALHDPRGWGSRIYALLILLAAGAGAGVAGRQVWLQSLPADQVPACGPGFDYLVENFPLLEALGTIMRGSGDCAKIDWTLFGFAMPVWTLALFSALGLVGAVRNWMGTR